MCRRGEATVHASESVVACSHVMPKMIPDKYYWMRFLQENRCEFSFYSFAS